mmetsp:Transcript_27116/g.105539  ORF Transcript_27116/g.105539 Transcript_27116/m.105539 type:complete len:163 (-) Transcript_27116:950-1438(-)
MDIKCIGGNMAFSIAGYPTLRRSRGLKSLKCEASDKVPGPAPKKPDPSTPKGPAEAADSMAPNSGRRGFLKVAIPSAIVGWWITGQLQNTTPDSLYDLSAVLGGERIALEEYRGAFSTPVNDFSYAAKLVPDRSTVSTQKARSYLSSMWRRTVHLRHSMRSS